MEAIYTTLDIHVQEQQENSSKSDSDSQDGQNKSIKKF